MHKLVPLSAFDPPDDVASPAPEKSTRRRFLAKAGVVGLITTVGVFNASGVASAYLYYCCTLSWASHCGYAYCVQNGEYIWSCDGAGRHCACCEWDARRCSGARCCNSSGCVYY
jgi:hypothetical protein